MDRYFKRINYVSSSSTAQAVTDRSDKELPSSKRSCIETKFDPETLLADPGLRKSIKEYHPNIRDEIRRTYLQKGPCQPRAHNFKQTLQGKVLRRFNPSWFDEFPTWLEYSIEKEAAYCLCCYLFRSESKEHLDTCDAFVIEGFTNWKKNDKLQTHVGGSNSDHNQTWSNCEALMNQQQHLRIVVNKQTNEAQSDYKVRLNASVVCVRFLLRQGLAFRGHDESCDSNNRGNFLEMLHFLGDHNKDIKRVILDKCPENLKLIAQKIPKNIVNACATETTNVIIQDFGDSLFSILVDEARDVSIKEQMASVIRYVDKHGHVIERLLGIVHVSDTSALSLKVSIDVLFSKHKLSFSRLRGQGYDGANNMQGGFNGLKALILKENGSAFYIHCFAHQLQLALIVVAKNEDSIVSLFSLVTSVVNVVGGSCKRHDILLEAQSINTLKALESGELASGSGQNQQSTLKRTGETRWGPHYNTLISLIKLFNSIIDVLECIKETSKYVEQRVEACTLLDSLLSFDIAFGLHLMKSTLGITNELSQALQRKDQDIVNAMGLVIAAKKRVQLMRDDGWNNLLDKVSLFCSKHVIEMSNLDEFYVARGRSRRNVEKVTNMHRYRVQLFNVVIDLQLQELNNRFNEVNIELLLCLSCLSLNDSFSDFNKGKLIRFAQFYPNDFSEVQLDALDNQLETFIIDVRSNSEFLNLTGISKLAEKMVRTKKNILYPLIYRPITLALILPVATASVERVFSTMKIVMNRLHNRMGDQWMADSLITYVEKDIFNSSDDEVIMQHYQNMRTRREFLSKSIVHLHDSLCMFPL